MANSARTLAELASIALTSSPAAQAVDYEGEWSCWADLDRVSHQVANLIAASGVRPGAPIAFVPRNRPAAIAAELGMLALGRPIQMIYAFQSPRGLARDIRKLAPGLVVLMAEDLSEEVTGVLKADGIAAIALRSTSAEAVPGLERSGRTGETDNGPMRIEILTSGTTGPPKRYSLHESAILGFVQEPVLAGAPETTAAMPPALNYFPLGNLSGVYITLATLLNGLRLTLLDRFTLERWRNYVIRFRPPSASIPPTYFQALLDSDIAPQDLSSLKAMNAGASPLDPLVQRRFEERFNIPVLVSYGATEFGGRVAQMSPEDRAAFGDRKLGSVGRPFGGARFRILDPESGEILRCGQ